jgi:integrase
LQKKLSIFLQGLEETGADPGELAACEWIDINKEARTLRIAHPVKGHNDRTLPISRELMERFELLPKKSERIYPTYRALAVNYWGQRKRIAREFNNPRLLKITFTSFRHWKGTHEYHITKDILYVKELLGHKDIKNTMIYIDIEKAIYGEPDNADFISRAAKSDRGARALLEAGYQYVLTTPSGAMIFRKRK